MALRRLICERFIREPGYRFVELADPPRAKDTDYRQAVAEWHCRAGRCLGRRHRTRTPTRRRRRLSGMGRSVAVRQHAADPRCGGRARRHRLRRHPRHHRDPGADGPTSHPAQRHWRARAITTGRRLARMGWRAARWSCSTATARSDLRAADAHLVGRLPRHTGRAAGVAAPSARSATKSPSCGPRRAPATAGSWTPTYCVRQTEPHGMAFCCAPH